MENLNESQPAEVREIINIQPEKVESVPEVPQLVVQIPAEPVNADDRKEPDSANLIEEG